MIKYILKLATNSSYELMFLVLFKAIITTVSWLKGHVIDDLLSSFDVKFKIILINSNGNSTLNTITMNESTQT